MITVGRYSQVSLPFSIPYNIEHIIIITSILLDRCKVTNFVDYDVVIKCHHVNCVIRTAVM